MQPLLKGRFNKIQNLTWPSNELIPQPFVKAYPLVLNM
jgi:hypothetical protein